MCSLYLGENLISGNKPINLGVRNIGEIVSSSLPITDAGLHLLDGSLILGGGIYQGFVDYIAELYSETPTDWTQPVLTSNGTMGGSNFAVRSNVVQLPGNDIWHAFDGITSGGNYFHSKSGTKTGYIDIFNPVPIKITNFKIYNQNGSANRASSSGIIYGSNDGTSWTQLKTYTNSVQTAGGTWNIDLSANENYYRYYRMESTAGGSDSYWTINEIQITAKYKKIPNYFCTEEEWQTSVNTYGVCGKFVYDSVNNTVRLPKITGIVEGTTDVSALGDLVEAGLPVHTHTRGTMNITGYITSNNWAGTATANSALYPAGNGTNSATSGSGPNAIGFDASRSWTGSTSNPNYTDSIQNSSTVQPQTIKCFVYIVIANSAKTEIQVDIDEVATDLNGKADVDLSNMSASQSAKNEIIGWGMPDYSAGIDISTFTSSSNQFTAPCDGYIIWSSRAAHGAYINNILATGYQGGSDPGMAMHAVTYLIPKNTKWYATGYIDTSAMNNKFFPMKGAN